MSAKCQSRHSHRSKYHLYSITSSAQVSNYPRLRKCATRGGATEIRSVSKQKKFFTYVLVAVCPAMAHPSLRDIQWIASSN
jgi:hypothetical protein